MSSGCCEQIRLVVEVNDYHLVFNLNGVLVVIGEGQTRFRSIVLRPSLKEFLCTCVKKLTFKNTLLVDDVPHKNMFNPACSAIFFETFYKSRTISNYLFGIVHPYLKSLHLSRM